MKNVYTVGQVNAYIKNMFTQDYMLRSIVVSGEASNVKYHSSGHIYFTLKDNNSELSCVMYKWSTGTLTFRLKEGDQVEVTGAVDVYEVKGSYQLKASRIALAGAGALYEKFLKLREELAERGMFDDMYKQPLPKYPKRIGVVTAGTGAARRDIEEITRRRNPYIQLILYPAKVQGAGAKESIVAGIKTLENMDVDVIIVGRGGGSIEDLWAFNEECVAQAIFDCPVPIVSAVGHETDFTIADFVADKRASTPSAAAELTTYVYDDLEDRLRELSYLMRSAMMTKLTRARQEASNRENALKGLSPKAKLALLRQRYDAKSGKLKDLMEQMVDDRRHRLLLAVERMKLLSPLTRLEQGYASITDDRGKRVNEAAGLKAGDNIVLTLRDGRADAKIGRVTFFSDDFIKKTSEE